MDLAKTLIRGVVRAFYETKHILVIDALIVHSALPNEDLAFLLGMQQKDLRKLCGKLKEDRLLSVHSRLETREGQQRPINKDYYFIDFHATIDAIKYRIFHLTQKVSEMHKPSEEKKDFRCPKCKAQWTQMEVIDKFGPLGFECHRCGGLLEGEDHSSGDLGGHEKQSTLMNQLDSLLKMLQQVDSEVIPNNDFDTAFTHAKPVQRDEASNPIRPSVPLSNQKIPPAAVKGVMQVTAGPLDVSVTTSSESTAAEQAAEAQRNADIAAQNVLPVWHTTSTVTGESTVKSKRYSEQQNHGSALPKDVGDVKNSTNVLNDELAAYYAQMLQEKDKEAREDQEGEDSSGDDEDDFEDVDIGGSAIGTPSSSMSAEPSGPRSRQLNGSLKRKESESGSSAPATNTSTPAPSAPATNEGPVAKKVKFENLENGGPIAEPAAGDRADKDSDEDEEAEFEDAL